MVRLFGRAILYVSEIAVILALIAGVVQSKRVSPSVPVAKTADMPVGAGGGLVASGLANVRRR